MVPVSVVVVSYNTRDLLRQCLSSLGESDDVIVVDNASSDGSAEMVEAEFPAVRLIRNDANRGFGAANNQGIATARHGVVLLLNSDAAAHPGSIGCLYSAMEDPVVVAAGGKLVFPDGRVQNSCAGPLGLWAVLCEQTGLEKLPGFYPYWKTRKLLAQSPFAPSKVEQVMGACLMMRVGTTFDEDFFLYCEDTDLCRRLRARGEILYVPGAVFTHDLGSSSADRWVAVARYNAGKELYFRKHHGAVRGWLCLVLNRLGALWRLLGHFFSGILGRVESFDKVRLFWRVLTCRLGGPPRPDKPEALPRQAPTA